MKSGNTALKTETFNGFTGELVNTMTLEGTINKSYLFLGLVVLFAVLVWNYSVLVTPFMVHLSFL